MHGQSEVFQIQTHFEKTRAVHWFCVNLNVCEQVDERRNKIVSLKAAFAMTVWNNS